MSLPLYTIERPPAKQGSGAGPPLLVLLHGVGSNEQDLMSLAPELDGRFHIVSARAPLPRGPGGFAWYPVEFTSAGPVIDEDIAEQSRQILIRFLTEAPAAFKTDPEQTYLLGFSQGCAMTLAVALSEPRLLAGAVGLSGRLLPRAAQQLASSEDLRDFPLLVIHGTEDAVLPIQYGRAIDELVRKTPAAFRYIEHRIPHTISAPVLDQVSQWLSDRLDRSQLSPTVS